jgi:integrase/recombinase XerD
MSVDLDQALADYLSVRRALGFKLDRAEKLLTQFISYLGERHIDTVTTDHALAWAMLPADTATRWWAHRLSTVRMFASYLHALDPRVEVPAPGLIRCGPCRATPYLYSDTDIAALIHAAAALPHPLRAVTYQSLIGLLAVSGMRVGEAIGLDRDDLDADRGALLHVRGAKFGKTRLIPLHPSTLTALRTYLHTRDLLFPAPASPALLISTVGTRLRYNTVWHTFHRLVGQTGLTSRSPSCQPRIHDLRHSFAVRTLLDCYIRGDDVQALLPRLSTYLGHTDPKHTYWYLSAAPELLTLAQQRLDTHRAGRP